MKRTRVPRTPRSLRAAEPPRPANSDCYDVIVIGAGSAGLPLAIRAAERGARVLQLEADYRIGGTLHWSSGQISAAGTRLQRSQGIEDSPNEHFRDAQRIAHGRIDPVVLRLFVDHAAATIDWLMDLGFAPAPGTPVAGEAHEAYSTRRYLWGANKGLSILEALRPTHDRWVREGSIDLRLQTRMTRLMTNTQGAVIGVRASTPAGEVEFQGRNVVLASGGYAANPELWKKLTPAYPLCSHANPYSRGDGIVAASALGATVDGSDKFLCTFAGVLEDPRDPRSGAFLLLSPGARKVWEIFVDQRGRRFMQEDHPSIDYRERALLRQPDTRMNIVFDEAILQNAATITLDSTATYRTRFGRHPAFVKAKTLAELARQLGVPAANLRRSVREYNAAVAARVDHRQGKQFLIRPIEKPPFYAIKAQGLTVLSPAGLKVDRKLRVIGGNDRPIRNLYAAGEVLGFGRTSGDAFVGGLSLTPALTFGRLLGEQLLSW
ncbi:MAG: FAD-dependent oxidoreductase [Gammaproteobacteria bacterium]|nr:FAD-dependent oxidoreductase [Gammaproteobacteria bacterium]MBM4229619.1 FAD-dependent oxidoreductase [Gammaproteobacteria bacterium]MBM4234750.1 FAD-dependent oxidoreductase [Gammaproteobacteria bacterium]